MGAGYRMKISSRGQVVIPKKIRERLGLRAGDELSFQLLNDNTLAAEKVEPNSFEIAMARLRQEMESKNITQEDIDRAVEEVKQEIYDEVYGAASQTAA